MKDIIYTYIHTQFCRLDDNVMYFNVLETISITQLIKSQMSFWVRRKYNLTDLFLMKTDISFLLICIDVRSISTQY